MGQVGVGHYPGDGVARLHTCCIYYAETVILLVATERAALQVLRYKVPLIKVNAKDCSTSLNLQLNSFFLKACRPR